MSDDEPRRPDLQDISTRGGLSARLSLSRRTLLRNIGVVGAGGVAALANADAGRRQTNQRDEFDLDSVRWTARDRTFTYLKSGPDPSRESQLEPVTDIESVTKDDLAAVFTTHSQLRYLNVEWDRYGNPNPEQSATGAWKHTFVLNSYGMVLENVNKSNDKPNVWLPIPTVLDAAFQTEPVLEYLDELGYGTPEYEANNGFNIRNLVEIAPESNADNIAISVRRDPDLSRLLDPKAFMRSLNGLPADRGLEDNEAEQRIDQALRLLNQHALFPGRTRFSDVDNTGAANTRRLKKQLQQQQDFRDAALGLLLTLAGGLPGIAGAVYSAAADTLSILDALSATISLTESPNTAVPAHSGVFMQLPPLTEPGRLPEKLRSVAGHTIMFDVYVSPVLNAQNTGLPPSFSIRTGYKPIGDRLPMHKSIWGVNVSSKSSDSDLNRAEQFTADLAGRLPVPPAEPDRRISGTVRPTDAQPDVSVPSYWAENDRGIRISSSSDYVEFGPTASLDISVSDGARSGDLVSENANSGIPEIMRGTELSLDLSSTQLGGAPIESYRLDVEKYRIGFGWQDPADGSIETPLIDRVPDEDDSQGNLPDLPEGGFSGRSATAGKMFSASGTTSVAESIAVPGYYRFRAFVRDFNGREHTVRRRILVVDPDAPKPTVNRFEMVSADAESNRYVFEVDAAPPGTDSDGETDPRTQLTYLWAAAPADNDRSDVDTAAGNWERGKGRIWRHEEVLSRSERYRIWVLVIDSASGQSVLRSMEFGGVDSADPDNDGKIEDVNRDGQLNEADVAALSERLEEDSKPPKAYDFNDDGSVDSSDLVALLDEVNQG